MCNRLKPKQRAIVDFIETNGPATPRQIRKLLGCDIREAYDRLKRLRMAGIVKNIGKPKHPEYQLVQRWQEKIKRTRPAPAAPAAKAKPPAKAAKAPAAPSIADVCRQNWQGYEIHKIFGSARA
ncbi:hypothetical protein EV102420_36_00090 [Pseudescherichia vulneris NBRC 102420]|uniref:Uncharacterized protein n=1 Tax=Pseudescherichia vulneris NBRC 102420 TaxID=1115515 RepID=A0A090VAH5_PSEVU|nr:helix-turn-helix domain-containing protein [Pseudescherichia vulneris]GAL60334.1 hypothetical protein EV102420_36_00090 [Pseudescherichia vulneris NBRC 102420]STQ59717.1 Uncharacterised protein [Pseudescherichia vulneris]